MTADELLALPKGKDRYELVKGELITMPPAGEEHGEIANNISFLLTAFIRANQLGKTYAAETGFVLARDPDTVRGPDFAFVPNDRIPPGAPSKKFSKLVPALVLEVLSPGDSVIEVEEKIEDWLGFGVDEVWIANPRRKAVTIYATGHDPHTVRNGEVIRGSGILAGFSHPVAELFPG
jgi:Uma2 family endonuclease